MLAARAGELCASRALTRTRPPDGDTSGLEGFDAVLAAWLTLSAALNALNAAWAARTCTRSFWRRPSWTSCVWCMT